MEEVARKVVKKLTEIADSGSEEVVIEAGENIQSLNRVERSFLFIHSQLSNLERKRKLWNCKILMQNY